MNQPSKPSHEPAHNSGHNSAHEPLHAYQSKRDFALTPEPPAGGQSVPDQLRFVVQKHWASSLHYDFRLEVEGTMMSWAVPKGPSFDPSVKRMAVQVEDHPLAYADFEGTIPAKQYGAGKVIVWDAGTWTPLHDPQRGVREGNLKFELHGHKLHGRWVLVRMKGKGEKQPTWLLIKEKDAYARVSAEYSVVDELPASVKSLGPASRGATSAVERPGSVSNPKMPAEAVPSALPKALAPQLATLVTGPPPDAAEWLRVPNTSMLPGSEKAPPATVSLLRNAVQGAHETIDRLAASAAPAVRQMGDSVATAAVTLEEKTDQLRQTRDEWVEGVRSTVRRQPLVALAR